MMKPTSLPSAELRARILAEVSRSPAPTRAEHVRRVLATVGLTVASAALLFLAMGGPHVGTRPASLVGFATGSSLVAVLAITMLSRSKTMLGPPRSVLAVGGTVAIVLLGLAVFAMLSLWPDHVDDPTMKAHASCGAATIVQGMLPLAGLLLIRRGSDPVHPAITGAALGMTAGAWSATMAQLRCPHLQAGHCLGAHVLPVLLFAVVGAVIGQTLLKPGARS